jgi:hypothetical protein
LWLFFGCLKHLMIRALNFLHCFTLCYSTRCCMLYSDTWPYLNLWWVLMCLGLWHCYSTLLFPMHFCHLLLFFSISVRLECHLLPDALHFSTSVLSSHCNSLLDLSHLVAYRQSYSSAVFVLNMYKQIAVCSLCTTVLLLFASAL